MADVYEGYYLELADGSIWVVKGCCHEDLRVAAMPRIVDGLKYKGYGSAYNVVRNKYPHYLSKPFFTAREIPMVPISDAKAIIKPLRRPRCRYNTNLSGVASEVLELLESSVGGEWMITGSLLYCAADERSDIDVISYSAGPAHIERIQGLVDEGILSRPTLLEAISEAREDLEGMSLGARILQLVRGISSLYYKGHRITIRIVRCDRRKISKICSEKLGSRAYSAVLEIEDSSESSIYPYIYEARVVKAYSEDLSEGERVTAYSHRSRFASILKGSRLACIGVIEGGMDGEVYINLDQGFCSFWE